MEIYTDTAFCDVCDEETTQEFVVDDHERDSSNNKQTCLKCRSVKFGFSDEWVKPNEEKMIVIDLKKKKGISILEDPLNVKIFNLCFNNPNRNKIEEILSVGELVAKAMKNATDAMKE